jgi:hypothetical protein
VDRWRRVPVCDGHCLQFGGRLRSRPVPTAHPPRRWQLRHRRHLPNRGRADLDRTSSTRAVFGISHRLRPCADSGAQRGLIAIRVVLDDAHRDRNVRGALPVEWSVTRYLSASCSVSSYKVREQALPRAPSSRVNATRTSNDGSVGAIKISLPLRASSSEPSPTRGVSERGLSTPPACGRGVCRSLSRRAESLRDTWH